MPSDIWTRQSVPDSKPIGHGTCGETLSSFSAGWMKRPKNTKRAWPSIRSCYAHHALAYLGVGGHFERRVDRLNRALGNTRINSQERVYLHYALFKELDGVGDTVRAWQALEAGHKGKRHSIEFDPREETVLFDLMIDTCGPSPAYSATTDDKQKTPIFIIGMPRTGTTLLERILGGHPEMTLRRTQ